MPYRRRYRSFRRRRSKFNPMLAIGVPGYGRAKPYGYKPKLRGREDRPKRAPREPLQSSGKRSWRDVSYEWGKTALGTLAAHPDVARYAAGRAWKVAAYAANRSPFKFYPRWIDNQMTMPGGLPV